MLHPAQLWNCHCTRGVLCGSKIYLSRFIKNFSTLASALRELTRSNMKWRWAEREQEAVVKIKNSLLENATLAVEAETEVIVGANPVGLGAMLTQMKKDGRRPVTYISRSLSPVEQKYSQTEREVLAFRWACERPRRYLAGPRFKVVTDHKPLEAIFSSSNSKPPGKEGARGICENQEFIARKCHIGLE